MQCPSFVCLFIIATILAHLSV
uniref:Uncharacterized protein n=1 Tax=Anguilla anguilla TaxID=7936 RepID=A0A0E9V5I4_ANGAN